MSILASLPAPTKELVQREPEPSSQRPSQQSLVRKELPPYGQRKGFIPRRQEDFGDGRLRGL
jgi:SNW domain-containing protein 1